MGIYSAGCQVFQDPDNFKEFIKICEKSSSIFGNKFTYTLLTYKDLKIMKEFMILLAGGFLGWYLALNKEAETRQALKDAKEDAKFLGNKLLKKAKENEDLNDLLEEFGINKR